MGIIYGSIAASKGAPADESAFFSSQPNHPLVIAHRGGGGLAPENTLPAFNEAVDLGVDVLELDVHGTADGKLVVIHDADVARTTNGSGKIGDLTLAQIKQLDAGFRWTNDGGKTFPFRGAGITIPTLEEVFEAFPQMRFNIEPKQRVPSIVGSLCEIVREYKMAEKIVASSFKQEVIDEFRRECPQTATGASPLEAAKFLMMYQTGIDESYSPPMQALQLPDSAIVDRKLIEAAHGRNLQVHIWTVNDETAMKRLLDAGVDGIMTDYPERLLKLLNRRVNPAPQ